MVIKGIVILIVLSVAAGLVGFACMLYFDRTYFNSPPYLATKDSSDVLVVYYSRSGNTEALARAIAKEYNADILKLTEDQYSLDYWGWRNATNDARGKVRSVRINPQIYDLESYKLIFLGSPVWLYRPAPPIWSFVEYNNFHNASVVLFNTFNSRFKLEDFDEFKALIETQDGIVVDHIYIRRGRIFSQMKGEKLLNEAQKLARENKQRHGLIAVN